MKTPSFKFVPMVLAGALVAVVSGCGVSYSYMHSRCVSQLATPTGPITVDATADCSASISAMTRDNVSTVTYTFGDKRQVVIDAKSVRVDGALAHNIPPGTKKLTIDVKKGELSIQADGQPLANASEINAEEEIQ
jgi:hypothetical protein